MTSAAPIRKVRSSVVPVTEPFVDERQEPPLRIGVHEVDAERLVEEGADRPVLRVHLDPVVLVLVTIGSDFIKCFRGVCDISRKWHVVFKFAVYI